MRIIKLFIPISLLTIMLISCNSKKNIPYMKGAETISEQEYSEQLIIKPEAVIMPKDVLTIVVHSTIPEVVAEYNPSSNPATTNSSNMYKYFVDLDGNIQFPALGKINVRGLTTGEVEEKIKTKLQKYIAVEPLVTVRFYKYQVSVLGEVKSPGIYTVEKERVNILEALALAGDMTIYGKRDNVKIMREEADGKKKMIILDLNDKNLIYSPDFYLQQNDVVYVEPNKARAQSADIGPVITLGLSSLGVLISVVNLVVNLSKK